MMALGLFNTVLWVVVVSRIKTRGALRAVACLMLWRFHRRLRFSVHVAPHRLRRYCLLDSMASSMVIGRTGATLAEISFACQIALLHRRVVTQDWAIWKPEVAWLTGYFSVAVWVSMGLMVLPR